MKHREGGDGRRLGDNWLSYLATAVTGRRQLYLAGWALLLLLPDTRRAVLLGPSRETSSHLFVLLVPFFVELT